MRRRQMLRLLAGGAALSSLPGAATAHPTPVGTAADETTQSRPDTGYGPLSRLDIDGATEAVVSEDGTTVFVAATTGYAIVDISDPTAPVLLAERRDLFSERQKGPLQGIYDVKIDGETLLVVGPANPGQSQLTGAVVVDVSDPASPQCRAFYETGYPIHNCDLDSDLAYLTANSGESRSLAIVDVTGGDPTEVGRWSLTEFDEAWSDLPPFPRTLHDVSVQDGTAYLAHWDAGTWILDVSAPASPEVISHIGRDAETVIEEYESRADGYTPLPGNDHYAAVNEDATLLAIGREAWATEERPDGGPGEIDLYDISEPATPKKLATIDPPPTENPTQEGQWTTAHNFEFRNSIFYSSWYRGGVKRHDVSDPANPVELTWWADLPHAEFWSARVAVPGATFVAPSRRTATSPAGLYVFPDSNGETTWGFGDDPKTSTATATPTPTETETTTSSPGFGVGTALAALGLGALALWRPPQERP